MQKDILLQILEQSHSDCSGVLKKINSENAMFRVNEKTSTAGFLYRHIGESTNSLSQFLGGKPESRERSEESDLNASHKLFEEGYALLKDIVEKTSEKDWLEVMDNPYFGKISRIRLLTLIILHNSHHCGQISSAVLRGRVH